MPGHDIFSHAIDSMYKRLGRDAFYSDGETPPFLIRVIERRPENIMELGEGRIHAEIPTFEFRVSDVATPQRDHEIRFIDKTYRIEEEPRLDRHQLVWLAETLPV